MLVLAIILHWVLLPHPIDLMMDLALGRPALAVVAGAPTSMTRLMRPNNDFNPETFLNTLTASDQPMLKQFAAYLTAKDETISATGQD